MTEQTQSETKRPIIYVHVIKRSGRGYEFRYGWELFVDGEFFISSKQSWYFANQARSHILLNYDAIVSYFTRLRGDTISTLGTPPPLADTTEQTP